MTEDSGPLDGEARCPRCGAKVLETSYSCPQCAQVLTRKPDKDEAPDGVCECGHLRSKHILRDEVGLSPCIKLGCSCTAFRSQPVESNE